MLPTTRASAKVCLGAAQRRMVSSTHRRLVGSGVAKPSLAQANASVPAQRLKRALQETSDQTLSWQEVEARMAAMEVRFDTIETK